MVNTQNKISLIDKSKVDSEKTYRTVDYKNIKSQEIGVEFDILISDAEALPAGIASLTHKLTKPEYNRIRDNINEIGMVDPIEIDSEGKLLDGRHRILICRELGLPTIACKLVDTSSETIVAKFMKHEVGRDNSATQRAILAAKLTVEYGIKSGKARAMTGASQNYYSIAKRMLALDPKTTDKINDGHAYYGRDKKIITSIELIEKDMLARKVNPFEDVTSSEPMDDWQITSLAPDAIVELGKFVQVINQTNDGWNMFDKISKLDLRQRRLAVEAMNEINEGATNAASRAYNWFVDNIGFCAVSEMGLYFKTKDIEWVREHQHKWFEENIVAGEKYYMLEEIA